MRRSEARQCNETKNEENEMITIEGMKDSRVVKCILHRVADIPGGGTVAVAGLGGKGLAEGTPRLRS